MLTFAALAMCVGWGLRGYIGGGPLGAMIPGSLVALAICLNLNRNGPEALRIAAFGAVGIGFGGEMTYGQTVGFLRSNETLAWGLLGLGVKGAIWGLLGGAVLGTALENGIGRSRLWLGFAALIPGADLGWQLVNEPKLIYFSHRTDQPRAEIWAGLLLAAVLLMTVIHRRRIVKMAGWGAVAGGIGFAFGGVVMTAGRLAPSLAWLDWWKGMEFVFGACLGFGLAWAAQRAEPNETDSPVLMRPALALLIATVLTFTTLTLEEGLGLRYSYVVVGVILLVLADWSACVARQIAITVTVAAAAFDLGESTNPDFAWLLALIAAALLAFPVSNASAQKAFYLLLWTSVGISWLKTVAHPLAPGHVLTELAFTAGAFALHGMARSGPRRELAGGTEP